MQVTFQLPPKMMLLCTYLHELQSSHAPNATWTPCSNNGQGMGKQEEKDDAEQTAWKFPDFPSWESENADDICTKTVQKEQRGGDSFR